MNRLMHTERSVFEIVIIVIEERKLLTIDEE